MAKTDTVQPQTELGERLEAKREELDMGVEEMATYMGVSKIGYHGWLRGARPTAKKNVKRIMEVLEIDLMEFWDLTPDNVHSLNIDGVPLSGRTVNYRRYPTVRVCETTDWDHRPIDFYVENESLRAA